MAKLDHLQDGKRHPCRQPAMGKIGPANARRARLKPGHKHETTMALHSTVRLTTLCGNIETDISKYFLHIAWPHHRECWFGANSCGSTWLHRDPRMAFQRRIETCLAGPVVTIVSIWYARSALSAVSLEYTVCCTNVGLARNLLILESPRASLTFTPTPEIQQAPSTVRTRKIKKQNPN
jgi:hypothetical protein